MHPWKGRGRRGHVHPRKGMGRGRGHPWKGRGRRGRVQVDILGMGRGRCHVLGGIGRAGGTSPQEVAQRGPSGRGQGPALSKAGQTSLWVWGEVRIHGGAG